MADSAVMGILKTMVLMDTANYESGAKKVASANESVKRATQGLKEEVQKLTPQAERMVKAFGGDKLLYTANSTVAAVNKLGGATKLSEAEQARVNRTLTDAIAKYTQLGQVAPKAMVDLERQTRRTADAKTFLTGKVVALTAAAGVMAAQFAGQAIRSVITMGREAFQSAGKIIDLSQATGLSTRTIQQMDFAAKQGSGSLENFTTAAFNLGVRIASGGTSVIGALRALGLEWEKIRGLKMDDQWNLVAEALGEVTSEGERNRLGTILMGKTFKENASAIVEGWREITSEAKIATEQQLRDLDRLNKEWEKWKQNQRTGFAQAMGQIALEGRIRREVAEEFFARRRENPQFSFLPDERPDVTGAVRGGIEEEIQRRMQLNLDLKTKDIQLTEKQAEEYANYVKDLQAARAELSKLSAAEREQIDAAQQLSTTTQEELIAMLIRFGVKADKAEDVLKLYNVAMTEAEKASKALAKSQKELAEEAAKAAETWFDVLVQMDRAELAFLRRATTPDESFRLPEVDVDREMEDLRRAGEFLEQRRKDAADFRAFMNFIGEREIEDEGRRIEERKQQWLEYRQFLQSLFAPVVGALTGGLGSLLFGSGDSNREADRAKKYYEDLKKSGKASAEEITRAYLDMQHAQRESESRWAQYWNNVKQGAIQTLNQILSYITNQFFGGILKSLSATVFGQRIGGFVANALGLGGAAAGIGGAAAGAASIGLASAVPAAIASQGVSATVAGGAAAGGGGAGAAIAGLATNPITIGIAAGIGGALLLKKLGAFDNSPGDLSRAIFARQLLRKGVPINKWPDWIRSDESTMRAVQEGRLSFATGGFVPPNTVQPAILHGGTMGEIVMPVQKMMQANALNGPAPPVVHHHSWKIQTWDAADFRRNMPRIISELKFEAEHNQHGMIPAFANSLGMR